VWWEGIWRELEDEEFAQVLQSPALIASHQNPTGWRVFAWCDFSQFWFVAFSLSHHSPTTLFLCCVRHLA
jgi:hypothetical protein